MVKKIAIFHTIPAFDAPIRILPQRLVWQNQNAGGWMTDILPRHIPHL